MTEKHIASQTLLSASAVPRGLGRPTRVGCEGSFVRVSLNNVAWTFV